MKDCLSFFGVVKGKYNSVKNAAVTAGQQASWRSGQSSLHIQRRSSVFVNQFFKETGSGKHKSIRPRCKCSISKALVSKRDHSWAEAVVLWQFSVFFYPMCNVTSVLNCSALNYGVGCIKLTNQCRPPCYKPTLILHMLPASVHRTFTSRFKGVINLKSIRPTHYLDFKPHRHWRAKEEFFVEGKRECESEN
jgi:hypothetical protein